MAHDHHTVERDTGAGLGVVLGVILAIALAALLLWFLLGSSLSGGAQTSPGGNNPQINVNPPAQPSGPNVNVNPPANPGGPANQAPSQPGGGRTP
jgi:hypothetical protein